MFSNPAPKSSGATGAPAQKEDANVLVITATSSGYEAGSTSVITLNNAMVACQKNTSGHHRGLHVVVVDPLKKAVACGQVFDTYKDSWQLE